jgi:hypothetical protein
LGWVSAITREGQTIWIVDAHGYGKRFIVRADEKLTAFLELEVALRPTSTFITALNRRPKPDEVLEDFKRPQAMSLC